jgi:hypothetical protein
VYRFHDSIVAQMFGIDNHDLHEFWEFAPGAETAPPRPTGR